MSTSVRFHHRELRQVESGMEGQEEWASEGESKVSVDETERRLRYQIVHMMVCSERARVIAPGRVAPQEMTTDSAFCELS